MLLVSTVYDPIWIHTGAFLGFNLVNGHGVDV